METEITLGETFIDRCVSALNENTLTAEEAAMGQVVVHRAAEACGGPVRAVARWLRLHERVRRRPRYTDARVTSIYGGTTEIMKEIIGRSMGFLKPDRQPPLLHSPGAPDLRPDPLRVCAGAGRGRLRRARGRTRSRRVPR